MHQHLPLGETARESIATLTSKGQITVPVAVRRQLGLKAGDRVLLELTGKGVTLSPATSRLDAGYQSIPALSTPKMWDEVERSIAEERAEQYALESREGRA